VTIFLIRRLALSVFVLWGVLTLSYALTCMAPGDAAEALAGQQTDVETLSRIRAKLGVDRDPLTRYALYLRSLASLDWGTSSRYGEPVWDLILSRFPRTLLLAASSILFAAFFGVALGMTAGIFRGTRVDRWISFWSLAGISAPVFWIGMILVWVLSVQLNLLPPSGYESGNLAFLVLPALTLGLRSLALITRISRATMVEVASAPFLRTAWAKGLPPLMVYGKHTLRNAALPIVTVIGLDLGSYLSGSVLTEKVFAWPGLGRLMVDGILARDTALINACVIFMAGLFILVNLAVDICYAAFDPRTRSVQ
jgi:peptide/nickel transport system permease protein